MKSLSFVALTFNFAVSIAEVVAQGFPQACADPRTAAPLYRAYSLSQTDHFYTTDANEHANAVKNGYSLDEGITGYVFSTQGLHSTALYRMYNPTIQDHFYTTSAQERSNAISNLGYNDEGITGYVYPDGNCGGLPLWRLYSGIATDHFYTMSTAERNNASSSLGNGYAQEGIAGYILPY